MKQNADQGVLDFGAFLALLDRAKSEAWNVILLSLLVFVASLIFAIVYVNVTAKIAGRKKRAPEIVGAAGIMLTATPLYFVVRLHSLFRSLVSGFSKAVADWLSGVAAGITKGLDVEQARVALDNAQADVARSILDQGKVLPPLAREFLVKPLAKSLSGAGDLLASVAGFSDGAADSGAAAVANLVFAQTEPYYLISLVALGTLLGLFALLPLIAMIVSLVKKAKKERTSSPA